MARLILFLFMMLWQVPALAQDRPLLLERSFFTDEPARLTLEELPSAKFRNFQGDLSLGFQSGAVWVRLEINKVSPRPDGLPAPLVLRVGPHYLDDIELYTQQDGRWTRQVRGALREQGARPCPDDTHCFEVAGSSTEASTVYLKVQHQGFMVVQTEVLSIDDLPFAVAKRVRSLTVSMIIAIGLLMLGIGFLLKDRTLLLLLYCGFQATIVLFLASNTGVLNQIFSGASPMLLHKVNVSLYVLRVIMTVVLGWAVLAPHRPGKFYDRSMMVMLALCAANVLCVFLDQIQLSFQLSLLVFSINPFLLLYGTRVATDLPVAQRRVLTIGVLVYVLMLVVGLWMAFRDVPGMPNPGSFRQIIDWRLNGFAIGVIFFSLTMLERRAQNKVKAREIAALRDRAVLATTQQAQLAERSTLIDMLTHELKNPLSTIRFAVASLKRTVKTEADGLQRIERIDASIRRMDELIEHVAYTNKIERATATDRPESIPAAPLLQELLADRADPQRWDVHVEEGTAFRCDRNLLLVILENLVSNALKYAQRSHKIRINLKMENTDSAMNPSLADKQGALQSTCFEISNHVSAESAPDESQLFERYYRHTSAQSQPGLGLGLNLARTVAEKIGGQVFYRYEQGQVFFTLKVNF